VRVRWRTTVVAKWRDFSYRHSWCRKLNIRAQGAYRYLSLKRARIAYGGAKDGDSAL